MSCEIMNINDEDIEMIDSTTDSFTESFLIKNRRQKAKRTYNKMNSDYKTEELTKRKEQFQLLKEYKKRMEEKFKNQNIIPECKEVQENQKSKCLIYQERVYDEEKEKKFVENYYKIKNEQLMKAIFS